MGRLHPRDLFVCLLTLPASGVLVACLFLPEAHWHMLLGVAALGVVPVAWQWRALRRPILFAVGTAAACLLIASVVGVAILVVLAFTRRVDEEQLVALCCFCLVLAFLMVFPFVALDKVPWAAAWVQLAGMITWATASR